MYKKIGLDAGHGLNTAGKRTPDGIHEWELNDKVRDKVVAKLKDYNVNFVFTDNDEGNVDESLAYRVRKYIDENVDVFVSIHHNAYTSQWNNATGVEVYTDINATQEDIRLAELIHKNLSNYTGLRDRGIKKENWYVINQNKIPAVLVEGGFMDSTIDYPVITSEAGQEAYARAVAEGLIEFLGLTKDNTGDNNSTSYIVKINTKELNVRSGAGVNYGVVTTVHQNELYTIVDEKMNGSTKWGKLKSGAGWISLGYTVKVNGTSAPSTVSSEYYPACDRSYVSIVAALKSINVDSSFANRKKIAVKNNIYNYTGTARQNNQLLDKLKAGKLFKI